jgi:hypothetical protein
VVIALAVAAWADPLALRAPGQGHAAAIVGLPELGIGMWTPGHVGLAIEARYGALGASVGGRLPLVDGEHAGLRVIATAGLLVPTAPAIGAQASLAVQAWTAGNLGTAAIDVACPFAASFAPDPAIRAPIWLEPWVGAPLTPHWTLGLQASGGPVISPGAGLSAGGQASVWIRWDPTS